MTIQEYFGDWSNVADLKEADRIVKILSASKYKVCPKLKNLFKAFHLCPFKDTRVVIIGQDPYPNSVGGNPVATGIAFANNVNTLEKNFSPSLKVLRESVIDFTVPHGMINFDPSLEKWERQGVLMLNSALSCQQNNPESHSLLWRPFMKHLLTEMSLHTTGIVYVLMGACAWRMELFINDRSNHVIKIRHPVYYARTKTKMPHSLWKEINDILIGQNGYGIEWYQEY